MKNIALQSIILYCLWAFPASAYGDVTGPARIIDGDTIQIGEITIRLFNIDAPDLKQTCHDAERSLYPCGERAARALSLLTLGQVVRCVGDKKDRHGHVLGTCFVDDMNLNIEMVLRGWAVVYRLKKYDEDYLRVEQVAKKTGNGMWAGKFIMPWDWQ